MRWNRPKSFLRLAGRPSYIVGHEVAPSALAQLPGRLRGRAALVSSLHTAADSGTPYLPLALEATGARLVDTLFLGFWSFTEASPAAREHIDAVVKQLGAIAVSFNSFIQRMDNIDFLGTFARGLLATHSVCAWQPFRGGGKFVLAQAAGWSFWTAGSALIALGTAGSRLPSAIRGAPRRCRSRSTGALAADAGLRVRGTSNVFALGDCATVAGVSQLPSAQMALQQSACAARNVRGALAGSSTIANFRFAELGEALTFGEEDASFALVPGLSDLLNVGGPTAAVARRLLYAARMPTPSQRVAALSGLASKARAASSV